MTAQRMEALARLVPGLAHELNNPLQAISGFSGLIAGDLALPEELRSDARLLVTEAARSRRIVQNLFDFARRRPPERHPTRLGVLVERVLELESYELSGRIDVEIDIPADLPPVPLDRAAMQQVVINLTQNAIEAFRTGSGRGTLRIAARQVESASGAPVARLAFADDGPGVAEEDRSRLFEPFFTTRNPDDHTGLGLFVSQGIVAGHGGSLTFEPGPDGGSVFTIELPLPPAGAGVPAGNDGPTGIGAGRPAPTEERRLHILLVDDDESVRAFLLRALRASVDVVASAAGQDALEAIEAEDFDAIVCDHRMPGLTGIEVHERVAATRPELARHFILMTGDVFNPEVVAFAEATGARLVAKPFEIAALHAILAEVSADIATAS